MVLLLRFVRLSVGQGKRLLTTGPAERADTDGGSDREEEARARAEMARFGPHSINPRCAVRLVAMPR
jgi:hypothetical protein